jgi:hypothetical protein
MPAIILPSRKRADGHCRHEDDAYGAAILEDVAGCSSATRYKSSQVSRADLQRAYAEHDMLHASRRFRPAHGGRAFTPGCPSSFRGRALLAAGVGRKTVFVFDPDNPRTLSKRSCLHGDRVRADSPSAPASLSNQFSLDRMRRSMMPCFRRAANGSP